jgi:hypothetical protein
MCVPGDPEVQIDLITRDWAADAIAYVFDNCFKAGSIRNFCAGPEGSLTTREVLDQIVKVVEESRPSAGSKPVRMPDLVSLSEFAKYTKICRRDPDARKALRGFGRTIHLMAVRQVFRNSNVIADLHGSGISLPDIRQYFERVVRSCHQSEGAGEVSKFPEHASMA